MNEITKDTVKRILDLNIEGVRLSKNENLCLNCWTIIDTDGRVNFNMWNDNTLTHDVFKFNTRMDDAYIETEEQADEFIKIVADYFGVELEPKLTAKERIDGLYEEYLNPIVEELNKEHGGGFVRRDAKIFNNKERIVGHLRLKGERCGTFSFYINHYFETPNYTPIENVKVKKRFNVVEELCKIEMPGKMEIRNNHNVVCLEFNGNNIATLLAGRRIKYSNVFSREQRNERQEEFGDLLKPEQEREFVQWIADTLGGEYDA